MAFPTWAKIAGSAGGSSASAGVTGELLSPGLRAVAAVSNQLFSNLAPNYGELFAARRAGLISEKDFGELTSYQGLNWPINNLKGKGFGPWTDHLERAWRGIYTLGESRPSLGEIKELLNRGSIPLVDAIKLMEFNQYSTKEFRDMSLSLRETFPSPSDQILFSVREAYDEAVVKRFGYDDEFPPLFEYYMQKLGFIGKAGDEHEIRNALINMGYSVDQMAPILQSALKSQDVSWARMYWRSHWQPISPTQAYEAFHRLRKDVNGNAVDPSGVIFDASDLDSVLKIADYPKAFRDVLRAISYRPITRVDIRRLYRSGVLKTISDIAGKYQDIGYNSKDAELLAKMTIDEYTPKRLNANRIATRAQLCSLYSDGVLPQEEFSRFLYRSHIREFDELKKFDALTVNQQQFEAGNDSLTQNQIHVCQLKSEASKVRKQVAAIRKRYLLGDLTESEGLSELVKLGIQDWKRKNYIEEWTTELRIGNKYTATITAKRHCKEGLIDQGDLLRRLINIGWQSHEITRIIDNTKCQMSGANFQPIGNILNGQSQ
jgi:hypothetical protein